MSQICKQYEVKIDISHLNSQTVNHLNGLFREAKWYYNSVIGSRNISELSNDYYKISQVSVKVTDHFEARNLDHLSSQMKQELVDRTKDSLKALLRLKKNGRRVGALKFKSYVNSIPLKQYHNTWWIMDKNHIHIQNIKQKLRVKGLSQLPKEAEITSAVLIRKHGDFYLHVTTYQTPRRQKLDKDKESNFSRNQSSNPAKRSTGIDLGIRNQITLSDGIRINYEIPVTKKIKRLQRELSRRQERSNNWYNSKDKLNKEYEKTVNQKKDIRNKLIHKLTETYSIICCQDDPIKVWMKNYGSKILNTGLGGLTSALKQKTHTPILVPRFYPSTQKCSNCNAINKIERGRSVYHCPTCDLVLDRDVNGSRSIKKEGLKMLGKEVAVPTEGLTRRELTPVDTSASTLTHNEALVEYFKNIPRVRASVVEEAGSPLKAMIVMTLNEAHNDIAAVGSSQSSF